SARPARRRRAARSPVYARSTPRFPDPWRQTFCPKRRAVGAGHGFRQPRSWGGLESAGVEDSEIAYDEHGLVPCVVQDWNTGEVLTVAYVNQEALERTRATGQMHFFSRSRQELWHKGATSGNTMEVRAIRYDCDGE